MLKGQKLSLAVSWPLAFPGWPRPASYPSVSQLRSPWQNTVDLGTWVTDSSHSSGGWRPQAEAPAAKQPLFIPLAVCAWAFSHWVPVETDSSLLSSAKVSDPMGSEPHLYFYLFILYFLKPFTYLGFPGGSNDKESACSAGDLGSISGSARSPGEGNGNPLQYSCLENPMDRGAWWASVPGAAKSQTRLKRLTCTCSETCAASLAPRACSARSPGSHCSGRSGCGAGLAALGLWSRPRPGLNLRPLPWQADS